MQDFSINYFNTVTVNGELIALSILNGDRVFVGYNDEHPDIVDSLNAIQDEADFSCCFQSIPELWRDVELFLQ